MKDSSLSSREDITWLLSHESYRPMKMKCWSYLKNINFLQLFMCKHFQQVLFLCFIGKYRLRGRLYKRTPNFTSGTRAIAYVTILVQMERNVSPELLRQGWSVYGSNTADVYILNNDILTMASTCVHLRFETHFDHLTCGTVHVFMFICSVYTYLAIRE